MQKSRHCVLLAGLCFTAQYASDSQNKQSWYIAITDFGVNALSGSLAMAGYSPFHYLQNRVIQKVPIAKEPYFWFKGAPTLIVGKAPTIAVKMSCYEILKNMIQQGKGDELSGSVKIGIASVAGGVSGIINNFTHLIALHQENHRKRFIETVQQKIPRDLILRGLGTTVLREAIFTNVYLIFLKDIKKNLQQKTNNKGLAFICSTLCSGAVVAATTQPLMVIATNLYADMNKEKYKNGFDAACKIYQESGFRAFYQGSKYRSIGIVVALGILDRSHELLSSIINKK